MIVRPYYLHFSRNAKERFGLTVSTDRYDRWCAIVANLEPELEAVYLGPNKRDVPGRSVWKVKIAGHLMRVIMDDEAEQLVTCIPFDSQHPDKQTPRDNAAIHNVRNKAIRLAR